MPAMSAYLAADTGNDTIDVISWICIYVYAVRRLLGSKAATGGTDLGRQLRIDCSLWLTGHIYESKKHQCFILMPFSDERKYQ